MIRSLWFMVNLIVLVVGGAWIALRPGRVVVEWLDYTISVHLGLFLVVLILILLVVLGVFRLAIGLARLPERARAFREERMSRKGFLALTQGLSAVAAGDSRKASSCAREALGRLGADHGLALILSAQAARMRGDRPAVRQACQGLLSDPDTAFLGLRGLIHAALEEGDTAAALSYAQKAQEMHPKQPWIQKLVYDLTLRARDWPEAMRLMDRVTRTGALNRAESDRAKIALYVLQAESVAEHAPEQAESFLRKAHRIDPAFAPVIVRLARYVSSRTLRAYIEKAWRIQPHPDLVPLWESLCPDKPARSVIGKTKRPPRMGVRLRWMDRLTALNPHACEGFIAAARAAMEEGLWGEARARLEQGERLRPSPRLYDLWADLEVRAGQDRDAAAQYRSLAEQAPAERVWTCRETGRVYARWAPVAEPHGAFASIVWDVPLILPASGMVTGLGSLPELLESGMPDGRISG